MDVPLADDDHNNNKYSTVINSSSNTLPHHFKLRNARGGGRTMRRDSLAIRDRPFLGKI